MGSSLYLSGGVQTTSKLTKTFAVANSFAVGDVVRYDVASTSYVKAQADSATNAEVVGVVEEATAGQFRVVYSGEIDLTSVSSLSGFSGPVLFLTSTVAGGLTANPPSAIGTVVKPLVVRNAATNQYVVTNFIGTQIGGSSTVAIDEVQPVGTIMPFAGSVIPDSWIECNGNSYAVGTYPQLYAKLQNSSGDRVPAYGYVATLFGTNVSAALAAGDYIQYKADAGAFTGQGSPFAGAATNASLLAIVLSVTSTSAVVQVIPAYSSTTKNFTISNTVFASGGFVGGETGTGNYRAYSTSSEFKAVSLTITSAAITHFNTPDLRGRFALGVNAPNGIGELDTDVSNYSAISGIYSLGSEGGQEFVVATPVSINSAATGTAVNVINNIGASSNIANIPPYTVVRYIIKASPYTRAAIIDGLDLPYSNLLVGDLRDGSLRPGGSGEDLLFKTNNGVGGTERMRLTNTPTNAAPGSLVVGESSLVSGYSTAYRLLDVAKTTGNGGGIVVTRSASVTLESGVDEATGAIIGTRTVHPIVFRTSANERMRIDSAGLIGMGGNPVTGIRLHLTNGSLASLGFGSVSAYGTIGTDGSSNTVNNAWSGHIFQNGGTEKVRITAAGDVGIGTNAPGASFDVRGSITSSSVVRATSFTGNGIIPIGGIIMWSGTIANIPSGWALCNGSNGTPDLTNRFVIGAVVDSTGAKTNITGTTTQTGGTKDATVVSHSHFIANGDNNSGAAAFATLSATNILSREGGRGSGSDLTYSLAGSATAATVGNTNTVGTSGTNANLPPYYALAFIMRTA
jgi:microcystin-dependent protein